MTQIHVGKTIQALDVFEILVKTNAYMIFGANVAEQKNLRDRILNPAGVRAL